MATVDPREKNLGYWKGFMQGYGRADYPTRAELYRDTLAYSGGAETAVALYGQVTALLGVATPPSSLSPQVAVA